MMMTGRRPSRNGYSKTHPVLLDFNPTLASVLKDAGYRTAAIVDNPNVAAQNGYAKGFDSYREVWEEKPGVAEADLMRAITDGGVEFLRSASPDRPFFLWLHYVNPHAPYTPPPRRRHRSSATPARPAVRAEPVADFHGGISRGAGRCGDRTASPLRRAVRWRDRDRRPGGGPR